MAFVKDETGILQTATNAAAVLVAAELSAGIITDGSDVTARVAELRDGLFAPLNEARIRDNAVFKAEEANKPAKATGSRTTRPAGTATGGTITVEQARGTELTFGKFKGVLLGDVFDMPASQAADYGHGAGDKAGRTYVEWLSTNENNAFMAKRASVLLDAARASSEAA
jgi:hypothetical protein